MKTPLVLLSAVLCVVVSQAATAQETRYDPLRRKVREWIESVLMLTDKAKTRAWVDQYDLLVGQGKDVTFLVDANVSRTKKALYATTWGGQLHTFEMTAAQAKSAGVARGTATGWSSDVHEVELRLVHPIARLDRLEIEGGPSVPGSREISGSFFCKPDPISADGVTFTLSISYRPGTRTVSSTRLLDKIPADGLIRFKIGPVNKDTGDICFGPTPVFFSLLMGYGAVVASNTLAVMLDVAPDLEAFFRLAFDLNSEYVDLLATIKDKPTAAKSIDDHKRFALRHAEVVKAMQRLGQTQEQDADFERRYGPQIDALARRLQEQIERLEKADYAGPTYFDEVRKALEKE